MISLIAIRTALKSAGGFLASIPREVWYALAVIAAVWWLRADAYSDGRESVLEELRTAEAGAVKRSLEAVAKADKAGAERAEIEAETRAADIAAIERAEDTGGNALDGLF
jgi:hypothetical protein